MTAVIFLRATNFRGQDYRQGEYAELADGDARGLVIDGSAGFAEDRPRPSEATEARVLPEATRPQPVAGRLPEIRG